MASAICSQCGQPMADDVATTVTVRRAQLEPMVRRPCPRCAALLTVAWYGLRLTWR